MKDLSPNLCIFMPICSQYLQASIMQVMHFYFHQSTQCQSIIFRIQIWRMQQKKLCSVLFPQKIILNPGFGHLLDVLGPLLPFLDLWEGVQQNGPRLFSLFRKILNFLLHFFFLGRLCKLLATLFITSASFESFDIPSPSNSSEKNIYHSGIYALKSLFAWKHNFCIYL